VQEKGVSQIKEFVTKLKEMNITVVRLLAPACLPHICTGTRSQGLGCAGRRRNAWT
jgi:hypothetical protein